LEKEKWGKTLKPAAVGAVTTPAPENGIDLKSWNISYLVLTEQDLAMPAAFQTFLIGQAREAGAKIETVEMKSGHFAQISHAKEVAKWIFDVAA
jgi:hypothetical protein